MGNLDDLHKEQDEFIKKTFAEDQLTSDKMLTNLQSNITSSNIKVKKYTYKQKRIIIILSILLVLSALANIYFVLFKHNMNNPFIKNQADFSANIVENVSANNEIENENENEIIENTIVYNTIIDENTVDSEIVGFDTKANTVANTTPTTITAEKTNTVSEDFVVSDEVNPDELKDLMAISGHGINRFSFGQETKESNTIFLYVAKQYFNKQSTSNTDTKYAGSKDQFHLYLKEAFGIDASAKPYISSYENFIGYNQASKTYIYGKDYTTLSKEKYSVTDVTITDEKNGVYSASCSITRTIAKEKTVYDVDFTFTLNTSYTYSKYCIRSLKAKNTSFYPDNTVHFVENGEVE